ncbi:hypothetical protein N7519_010453 [Penicillium mononematosum]|uniref:uncharacterized protein n=1 Tax=Penicillium mononematosum TaxID=268346 RepID=UPI0025493E13|nr:uncharacterized protein N7519_010453 [Penicillium mononematosum]KAJ6179992.1 hypothetical protein N7519_010453 [Penicillium mononematosum]
MAKAWYCSRDCQKADYKAHKPRCAPTIPYNCFLIRATPASDGQSDAAYIEPFHLKSYGNWGLEMKELKERLGWPQADEARKFYTQKDIDTWYYYMYQSSAPNLPMNQLASHCLGRTVKGDVAVVKSSPEDIDDYEESFTKMDLMKTIDYYKTANSRQVFRQREQSRLSRKLGMPADFLKDVPQFNF